MGIFCFILLLSFKALHQRAIPRWSLFLSARRLDWSCTYLRTCHLSLLGVLQANCRLISTNVLPCVMRDDSIPGVNARSRCAAEWRADRTPDRERVQQTANEPSESCDGNIYHCLGRKLWLSHQIKYGFFYSTLQQLVRRSDFTASHLIRVCVLFQA